MYTWQIHIEESNCQIQESSTFKRPAEMDYLVLLWPDYDQSMKKHVFFYDKKNFWLCLAVSL